MNLEVDHLTLYYLDDGSMDGTENTIVVLIRNSQK